MMYLQVTLLVLAAKYCVPAPPCKESGFFSVLNLPLKRRKKKDLKYVSLSDNCEELEKRYLSNWNVLLYSRMCCWQEIVSVFKNNDIF